jgi:L-aminopeptidase/D-esterase-like protein
MTDVLLPSGFSCGHWTDTDAWTGCTVLLAPEGSVGAGEVRGGGPGTRESDLLSPYTSTPGPSAVVFSGGSAYGLGAVDGVVTSLAAAGRGHPTPAGPVPLVSGAVVYDLAFGTASWPGPASGRMAYRAAAPVVERGCVGAGTGATVGKLLGPDAMTKGGLGGASLRCGEAVVTAVAAVNPIGDVLGANGEVLAGAWGAGGYIRATTLILRGAASGPLARENTTLVCVCTDARLTKLQAALVARAMSAGVARAVSPCATAWDGDLTACLASGAVEADPDAVAVIAAEATSMAIRDAVLSATGAPGCPSATDRHE